jgi:dTDP-glucose 4,6-dehydratase
VSTREIWEQLRGRSIFITGGTGFIGKWLLESFVWINDKLDLRARMVILTRDAASFKKNYPWLAAHRALQFVHGNVRDFAWPDETFYAVIHGAAQANAELNSKNPLLMVRTITEGTHRVLEMARNRGTRRLLYISSGAVYGKQPTHISHVAESNAGGPDPLDPGSVYGEAKRLGELLCSIHRRSYEIDLVIARCFAFVGPYLNLDIHFAIGNFIRDGLKGGPIVVKGDGTPLRSYLYASDLAIWLWVLLFKGKAGEAYNVGSEQAVSIAETARAVAASFDPPQQVTIIEKKAPGLPVEQYVPGTSKARQELGLRQDVDLMSAIRKTVEWHRMKGSTPET